MKENKRLKKIESLNEQKEKHKDKIKSYAGKDYALLEYWKKEIERFEDETEEEKDKLKK